MSYLSEKEINEICNLSVKLNLYGDRNNKRKLVFGVLSVGDYYSDFEIMSSTRDQLHSDLLKMNSSRVLSDNSVPLKSWLENAYSITSSLPKSRKYKEVASSLVWKESEATNISTYETKKQHTPNKFPFKQNLTILLYIFIILSFFQYVSYATYIKIYGGEYFPELYRFFDEFGNKPRSQLPFILLLMTVFSPVFTIYLIARHLNVVNIPIILISLLTSISLILFFHVFFKRIIEKVPSFFRKQD